MRQLTLILICTFLPLAVLQGGLFRQSTSIDGIDYTKMGEHRAVYKIFFKLYDAGLFSEPATTAEDVLSLNCAFRLEFKYLRSIPKETILKSANHMLAKNLNAEALAKIAEPANILHANFRSVVAGDTSSLTYRPNMGTTFTINGEQLVTLPGDFFAQNYLKIWLGERPISIELRDELLGR